MILNTPGMKSNRYEIKKETFSGGSLGLRRNALLPNFAY